MNRRLQAVTPLIALAMLVTLLPGVAVAASDSVEIVDFGDDVRIEAGESSGSLATQESDPLGLLVGVDTIRDHSLGLDSLEVWTCGASESASELADRLTTEVAPWFEYHSRGWYQPQFVSRGGAGDADAQCEQHSVANANSATEGALHLKEGSGGYASPGLMCGFTPCPNSHSYEGGNRRAGFIGATNLVASTVHEMGHMLSWPHSYTGPDSEYDNALDIMSGNYGTDGNSYGSNPEPYSTAVINLYAAGWIPPSEVYQYGGDGAALNLSTQGGDGWKMAAIPSGESVFTLAARIPSTHDPIPDHWSGVEVYEVRKCPSGESSCAQNDEYSPGFRRVRPSPGGAFDPFDLDLYDQPLPHVISPGESRTIGGVEVRVGDRSGQSFRVRIGENPESVGNPVTLSFVDTAYNTFVRDIEWLSSTGITRGCNPPLNSEFCPDHHVTRGQMAAFLHRALPDLTQGNSVDFADDNGHTFESDIEWLAATGVTRGCNPPANSEFCPNDDVTRGQMAAFLHRALPDLAQGNSVDFADDNGHTFESDIEWLAATGVTRGCNPPANDRFCPDDRVTRGAMAAFLQRALGD